jgi:DNA replication initiation complex subunit (GINS family)
MEEDSDEITISYETLFELLVRERSRAELQKLPKTFFGDIVNYINQKELILKQDQLDIKTKKEIENIKQIVKDLYNKREKKIVSLALDKSRTQSSIVNVNLLLKEEKELFDEMVAALNSKRVFLEKKLEGATSNLEIQKKDVNEEICKQKTDVSEVKESTTKLVRFLHAVPKFVGLEGEEYGPFEEEDVASLPSEIAELLVKKERVEEIEES